MIDQLHMEQRASVMLYNSDDCPEGFNPCLEDWALSKSVVHRKQAHEE